MPEIYFCDCMREIEDSVEIRAPATEVWNRLTGLGSMPYWNPFIRRIEGRLIEGSRILVTLQTSGSAPVNIAPKVNKVARGRELRWKGSLFIPGLFDGEHYFRLKDNGPCSTTFTQGERFTGLAVPLLSWAIGDAEKGIRAMNRRLKSLAEGYSLECRGTAATLTA